MEAFGAGILILMMVFFGISSLANAYEASQRWKRDEEDFQKRLDDIANGKPKDREE